MYEEEYPRFFDKIEKVPESGCWIWTGCLVRGDCGFLLYKNKPWQAHRFSYTIHKGPIPEGKIICHKCDVPCCVNPNHLYAGTYKDNRRDADERGKSAIGERNGNCKFDDETVRKVLEDPRSYKEISEDYGISRKHISTLKTGKQRKGLQRSGNANV